MCGCLTFINEVYFIYIIPALVKAACLYDTSITQRRIHNFCFRGGQIVQLKHLFSCTVTRVIFKVGSFGECFFFVGGGGGGLDPLSPSWIPSPQTQS